MLRRKTGTIERLDAGGLPLGIAADAKYETGTARLDTGDWVVVFTDGVVESVNERDAEYGEGGLISILNAGAEISAVTMLHHIMVDLDLFVGNTPQNDDITCLLIKAV
jgi:sigma-B regulation protein RsbU (phosphoserine phosphatase)